MINNARYCSFYGTRRRVIHWPVVRTVSVGDGTVNVDGRSWNDSGRSANNQRHYNELRAELNKLRTVHHDDRCCPVAMTTAGDVTWPTRSTHSGHVMSHHIEIVFVVRTF